MLTQASAAASAKTVLGNSKAISSSLANAIKGIATSTATADGKTLFGAGVVMSESQANAICGAALAEANSKCIVAVGGCKSIAVVSVEVPCPEWSMMDACTWLWRVDDTAQVLCWWAFVPTT